MDWYRGTPYRHIGDTAIRNILMLVFVIFQSSAGSGMSYSSMKFGSTMMGKSGHSSGGGNLKGMQVLGKVGGRKPAIPKPVALPSIKKENYGLDPTVSLVPSGMRTFHRRACRFQVYFICREWWCGEWCCEEWCSNVGHRYFWTSRVACLMFIGDAAWSDVMSSHLTCNRATAGVICLWNF